MRDTHFALVIYSPALIRKADSYVNSELALARRRASDVRGTFLIPLRTADIANGDRIAELRDFQEQPLRRDQYETDINQLVSLMRREFQRRQGNR